DLIGEIDYDGDFEITLSGYTRGIQGGYVHAIPGESCCVLQLCKLLSAFLPLPHERPGQTESQTESDPECEPEEDWGHSKTSRYMVRSTTEIYIT
ncbi:MAG: hypothetical protein P8Z42_15020, partial [Anaerolineales bacterium]